jgi:uncharacterized protein YbjT (DUF2867 family)
MKVLMIGATGAYAGLVLPELKKRAVTVIALVQDEAKPQRQKKPVPMKPSLVVWMMKQVWLPL